MYLFSFQYLTGVISLIVINQKIKIKSDHQDHGSSHILFQEQGTLGQVYYLIYSRLYFEVNFLDHSYRSVQIFHTHIPVQIYCARIFLLPPPPQT